MIHDCPVPPTTHFHFPVSLGAIIKLPPNPGVDVAYKDLVCTETDREKIFELFTTIAEKDKFYLLYNQTYVRGIGVKLNHVHPLKLIAVSMSTPYLKNCYKTIFEDYFKKNEVVGGSGAALTREASKGKLDQYLPAFAEEMGVPLKTLPAFVKEMGLPLKTLQDYVDARDWEGFLVFLMNSPSSQ